MTRWIAAIVLLATTGCAGAGQPADPNGAGQLPEGKVRVLSKTDDWRENSAFGDNRPFGLVEIAFDSATAQLAWEDNVPAGLPARDGTPSAPGVYGALDSVDFATHAVIVWSAGQSGSCPGWLSDIRTRDDGTVEITTDADTGPGQACTDDYRPYRMVMAVPRDRLPAADQLPVAKVVVDGRDTGLQSWVDGYPASATGWTPYPA